MTQAKPLCPTPVTYVTYWRKYQRCYVCKREVRDELHLNNHYNRYHAAREGQTTVCDAKLLTSAETISIVDNLLRKADMPTYSMLIASISEATKNILSSQNPHTPATQPSNDEATNHIQRREDETLVDYVSRYMEAYL